MVTSQPVNLLVPVSGTPLSLSASPAQLAFRSIGDQLTISILGAMSGGTLAYLSQDPQINWVSDTPAVATVNSNGMVTAVGAGSANITASLGGLSVTVSVTVPAPPPTPCTYQLSSGSANVGGVGGPSQLTVTTNLPTCSWAAVSWVPWVSVTSATTSLGSGSVSISVSPNSTGAARSGNVQIAGQGFTVNQAIAQPASLSVTKRHTGPFAPGQQGVTYSIVVSNAAGAGSTIGTVTVTEMPPNGLTGINMSGTGWSCNGNTCSRGDSIPPGMSYAAIGVTANVASNAQTPLVNSVSISGGYSAGSTVSDPATVTTGSACDVANTGTVGAADVQRMINEVLGSAAPTNDLNQDGVVNIVDVQVVIAAALGWNCLGG